MSIGFLLAIAAVVFLGPVIWRMTAPIPPGDRAAVEYYLSVQSQKLERLDRLLIGGPWRLMRAIPIQVGRPYRALAREADGSLWKHIIAIDGLDEAGGPYVREKVRGVWSPDSVKVRAPTVR